MTAAAVHVVVPEGIDDPARPSGGNRYDRRVVDGLRALGRRVHEHAVGRSWPEPSAADRTRLAAVVAAVPDASIVLVDGLVASAAADVLVPAAGHLRLVVLVHLPLLTPAERAVLAVAAAVVTTSEHTRQALVAAYGSRPGSVHAATPGVDPAPLAVPDAGGRRLLVVGAVSAAKGHDVLVDALAALGDREWSCDVVGPLDRDPDLVAGLRARIGTAGLGDRVRLVGPRGGAALDAHYASADLLVLPSRGETYGMVVTEALARGVPVVASDVGGVPEALGGPIGDRPGRLVPSGEPSVLAATIRDWLTDAALRATWRAAARRRRDTLDGWAATAATVAAVLDRADVACH